MDIPFQGSNGPADILLSENLIRLHGVSIPSIQIGLPEKVRKVKVAERVTIPGNSEMIVDALIERSEEDDHRKNSIVIMEPRANFKERHMLLMAASLADRKHNVTHKVLILNPFAELRVIAEDSVIGSAEEIESMESVISLESETKAQDSQWDAVPILISSNETPINMQKILFEESKRYLKKSHLILQTYILRLVKTCQYI